MSSQRGDELILSKRTVLQQIASVYDPLDLFSPLTLRGKYFYKIYGVRRFPGIDICQNETRDSGIS